MLNTSNFVNLILPLVFLEKLVDKNTFYYFVYLHMLIKESYFYKKIIKIFLSKCGKKLMKS